MNKKTEQINQLEFLLREEGISAIVDHKSSRLYASVNPVDKFVLVMRGEVENVIMDVVGRFSARWQWDWWNDMNNKPWNQAHQSKFYAFVNKVTEAAYEEVINNS